MVKHFGCLTAALLAGALAMPSISRADPPHKGGNAPAAHAAPHGGGGAPHFAPHGGGAPHFAPHGGGGPHFAGHAAPHFTAHSAGAPHFAPHRSNTPHFTRHFTPHVSHHTATVNHFNRHGTHHNTATVNHSLHAAQPNLTTGSISRQERRRHGRGQHNLAHQTPNGIQARPNLATAPNTHHDHGLHHNRNGITAQTARQGRFASAFAARAQSHPNWRSDHMAARRAWHHHHRAGFVAWYGPVFWPYAYSDIFDYAFWPDGYDDGYWAYAYDDFMDGLFWGESGPPEDYAYAYAPPRGSHNTATPRVSYAGVQELCKEPGTGVTAWPFTDIQRKVGLNDEQKQLLADVKKAAADAAATFKASCPSEKSFPLTPPGRLSAMTGRLQATLEAVDVVQPALDKFYNSLSDEQKERFNQLGPQQQQQANPETTAALPQDNKTCKDAKPGLANLPIEKIDEVVKPTDAQQADFTTLQDATQKAVSILQAACPDETPLTPPGRLDAMKTRLKAMIDAANTVKQPLDSFYASLSNEQKARFDRIGRVLAQAND